MNTPEPIRKFIRRKLLRVARRFEGTEQEGFDTGGDGVPDADERAVMTAHQLAQVAADAARNQGSDSVAFILISHELQMKLAEEQSTATYRAAVIGIIGIGIGAYLNSKSTQINNCPNNVCRGEANQTDSDVAKGTPVPASRNIPASASSQNAQANKNPKVSGK